MRRFFISCKKLLKYTEVATSGCSKVEFAAKVFSVSKINLTCYVKCRAKTFLG